MKKLLFISLLISVPLWGMESVPLMEEDNDDDITVIYYEMDSEKCFAWQNLEGMKLSEEDTGYATVQTVKKAKEALDKYVLELEENQNKNAGPSERYQVECKKNWVNGAGICFYRFMQFKMISKQFNISGCWPSSSPDKVEEIAFSSRFIKQYFKALPYISRIVSHSEFEEMRQQQLAKEKQEKAQQKKKKIAELLKTLKNSEQQ